MKALPKINILLSTYNGAKYLSEQLDSIFQQTFQNFTLYIRDDASSDTTVALLHTYIHEHPNFADKIVLLPDQVHQNLGYMGSFWLLLDQCAPADYYAFCDQDDIWLPNKLEAGLYYLEKENAEMPLLYFSNYNYCDEKLNVMHEAPNVSLPITFRDVLFYTPAFGFSIIINEKLRAMALQTTNRIRLPHDGWVQKIAAAFGKILYNPAPTALYRRHSSAVTSSNAQLMTALKYWIQNDILGSSMKETRFVLERFMEEYGTLLSEENYRLLALYTRAPKTLLSWFKQCFYKKRFRPSIGGDLALRVCFFLGRY